MSDFKKIFLIFFVFLFFGTKTHANLSWNNDLKNLFLSNQAIIYAVNIRTFNAKDSNKNGIIETKLGEERGNFLNAISRLDELYKYGINTIQLLPVLPVGKTKALGTAGSLYAPASFNELNPQLKAPKSKLTIYEEMKKFVDECHKRKIRVIVDLPCCASYDLYLRKPELFLKDKDMNPVVPSDWTDVRLLDAGTNNQINNDVYNLYSGFVDLMIEMNVDGIRANVPTTKPSAFWKKLIDETKNRNPQFLFIAEASPLSKQISNCPVFTTYGELLDAGFDGCYWTFSELKDWQTSKDLISSIKPLIKLSKKYSGEKAVLGNFVTHDQISPILVNGPAFSELIIWLNATLPVNTYYIDGFTTGDNYIYFWANKKAKETFTDDDYYFVHRGQLDIFNFSRKPQGKNVDILSNTIMANKFKEMLKNTLINGTFHELRTSSSSVFAYARSYNNKSIIVIGNLNFKAEQKVNISVPHLTKKLISVPVKIKNTPQVSKNKITTLLSPGEVQVLLFESLDFQ